jgi:hypothetical protein
MITTLFKTLLKATYFVALLIAGAYVHMYLAGMLLGSIGYVLTGLIMIPLLIVQGLTLFDIFKK